MGHNDGKTGDRDDPVVRALLRLAAGRPGEAVELLTPLDEPLGMALAAALGAGASSTAVDVYVEPAAFTRFIETGNNPDLYSATNLMVRGLRPDGTHTLLDIGCGDGRVSAGIVRAGDVVDLVEPSTDMLTIAEGSVRRSGVESVRTWPVPIGEMLHDDPEQRWDLAISTFALHNLDRRARADVLVELHRRVGRLAIVEFDVPAMVDQSVEHAVYCARAYRRGVTQHPDALVIQGFLMPVLIGQFLPGAVRHTHEQPIATWADDLRAAGFRDVHTQPVFDGFWWADAHVVVGTGSPITP